MDIQQKIVWFKEYTKYRILAKRQGYINAPYDVVIDKTYNLAWQVYQYLKLEIDEGNYCAWVYSPIEKIIVYTSEYGEFNNMEVCEVKNTDEYIKGLTTEERMLRALKLLAQIYAYINIEDQQRITLIYPVTAEFNLIIARTEDFDDGEGIASVGLC